MISKLLRNDYSLNLINKVYTIIMGLLSSAFLTRYLGVVYKGDYSYISQIVVLTTIVLNMGIHQSYSFYYKKNNGNMLEKYVNLYGLQFIIYLSLAIVLSVLLDNQLYIYAIILLPFSVITQQMENTMAVENIRLKIKLHMFNVTIKMFSFALMFIFMNRSLIPPIIMSILINIISVLVYFYYSKIKPQPMNNNLKFVREIISYSWVPMLTAILITLNYSIDIFFLKHMGSSIQLGLYSTAVGIINYVWLVPDAFKEVLISRVAREDSTKSTLLAIKVSVISVIFIIIAFGFFGRFAINILYGQEFINSFMITLILSIGAISMVFYKMIGVVLLSKGKRWVYFFSLLTSVIINIILNIITIPKYGMYGAAISSTVSYSVCGMIFLVYFIKSEKINLSDVFLFKTSEIAMFKNLIKRR